MLWGDSEFLRGVDYVLHDNDNELYARMSTQTHRQSVKVGENISQDTHLISGERTVGTVKQHFYFLPSHAGWREVVSISTRVY